MEDDRYRTLEAPVHVELPRIKGSRFIADAFPVTSVDEVRTRITEIKGRDPSATHHCYAYRLGTSGNLFRYSDDGEPSGTAGKPILRQIDAHNLTNTLVVVTRYFGGTKLGTGGLIRAYGEAAREALRQARIVERHPLQIVEIRFPYTDTSAVMRLLHQYQATILNTSYGEDTSLQLSLRQADAEAFSRQFTEALRGQGSIRYINTSSSDGASPPS